MSIDRSNYEIFFLDYYEGNLPPVIVEELMAFLHTHPELKAEFDGFELLSLPGGADQPVFEDKEMLKRGAINRYNYEWYFAAFGEGDLMAEEAEAVEAFAALNPTLQRELQLMLKTRLLPAPNIVFSEKGKLRRHKVIPLYSQFLKYGVAAVFLLMVALFFLMGPQVDRPGLASITQTPQPEEPSPAWPSESPTVLPVEAGTVKRVMGEPRVGAVALSQPVYAEQQTPVSLAGQPALLASRMQARPLVRLAMQPVNLMEVEQRSEFAYWHHRNREEEMPIEYEPQQVSLFHLAYQGFQRNISGDYTRGGQQMPERQPNLLLGLAGASLIGLNKLLGSPVNIYAGRDENGRLVQLAFGNAIEINRK